MSGFFVVSAFANITTAFFDIDKIVFELRQVGF